MLLVLLSNLAKYLFSSLGYYTGTPIFPAFTGMSLTTFDVTPVAKDETLPPIVFQAGDTHVSIDYAITVTNNGTRAGDEVVFMFAASSDGTHGSGLIRRLTGFERVHLLPGASQVVHFQMTTEILKVTNSTGDIVSMPGNYIVSFTTGGTDGDLQHPNVKGVQHVRIESTNGAGVVMERFPKYPNV